MKKTKTSSASHESSHASAHTAMQGHDKNHPKKPIAHNRIVLAWTAPEYLHQHKPLAWYIGAALTVLLLITWGYFSNNWTMVLAIVVFAAVYTYLHHYHPPKNIPIEISEMGIRVGHIFHPYSHIQAFWIHYQYGLKTLNLRVHKQVFSDVVIQLEHQDPVEIRHYLVSQIPEWEGKTERVGEMVLRLLKF